MHQRYCFGIQAATSPNKIPLGMILNGVFEQLRNPCPEEVFIMKECGHVFWFAERGHYGS
jgi:hypothetical protein